MTNSDDQLADLRHNLALRAFTAPDADDETLLSSLDARIRDALTSTGDRDRSLASRGIVPSSLDGWLRSVRTAPPGPLLLIGNSYNQLTRNVLTPLAAYGPPLVDYTPRAWSCRVLGRQALIITFPGPRSEQRLCGALFAGVYVDSACCFLLSGEFLGQLQSRLAVGAEIHWGQS